MKMKKKYTKPVVKRIILEPSQAVLACCGPTTGRAAPGKYEGNGCFKEACNGAANAGVLES